MPSDFSRQTFKDPLNWLSWGLGSGLSPCMPGTVGSLVGCGLYLGLADLPLTHYLLLTGLLFIVGIGLCRHTATALGVHDHASIVWDEIVGMLVTMIAAPRGWYWLILGFLLFRLFDIWKPWPIRWLDRHVSGGFGIMVDDLLAAIYAAVLLQIAFLLISS